MASFTRRLWMPVMGGRGRPLAGAAAGAPAPLGDWGLAGVPPSVALPDSADDWDSEEGAAAVVAVVLAILFILRFSFLSFFFFLRSFLSFFFSFLRRLAYSGSSLASGPDLFSSSSDSSARRTSGAQPSRCSLAIKASRSSESFGGL